MPVTVTLICTVLNEGASIERLMQSIAAQTRQPDEVIFVDGGSRDATVAVIGRYADRLPLRVLVEPGANISRGRNVAIAAATGEVIAATDAGVRLEPGWLAALIAPFERDAPVDLVAGFFHADAVSTFEVAMGATVLPLVDEIDPAGFLPSSRSVAFRRRMALDVGGYPEWLDYCEDLIFDLRMKAAARATAFAPEAVAHFRPRGSLKAYFKQYYLYARGDGKADLWRKRHAARYATYLGALPAGLFLALRVSPLFWGLLAAGGLIYVRRPYQRLARLWRHAPDQSVGALLKAAALVPVIRAVGDVAKMLGYPVGVRWRLKHKPPSPPDWTPPRTPPPAAG